MPACPDCGLDLATVSPSDAAVAVRSYPRRFRALLTTLDPDDTELATRRPGPGEWSAAEHASHVGGALAAAAEALNRIAVGDDPDVDLTPGPPAHDVGAALERLALASAAAAAAIDGVHGRDWERTGRLACGAPVTALDVARQAVHTGAHHLRQATRALERA